jgi:hypothetical protein
LKCVGLDPDDAVAGLRTRLRSILGLARAGNFARIAQFTSGPSANRLKINCQNISDSNQRKTKRLATSTFSIRQALNCYLGSKIAKQNGPD